MNLYGLAFVKNGVKFDYPFIESLDSLSPLVEKTYINVGVSDDGTLEKLQESQDLKIIEVDWDEQRTDKGHILSDMTDVALKKLREEIDDPEAWVIYLQSDEVLHEQDYQKIREDIQKANDQGHDVLRFRYLHFWQKHNVVTLNERWYPVEIRAFKLHTSTPILSHGDAQTFENWTSAFDSDAYIYHYGHVREQKAYKQKMERMHRYYHRGFDRVRKSLKTMVKNFLRNDREFFFYGDHPIVMKERIARLGGDFIKPSVPKVSLLGDLSGISEDFMKRINADEVLKNEKQGIVVNLDKAPKASDSRIDRPWNPEFRLLMALSQQEVGLKKINSEA